ncbi:MAG: hypothetical protein AAF986_05575 [Pseudomonadota bacterium]
MSKDVFDQIKAGLNEAMEAAANEAFLSMVHNGTSIIRVEYDGEKPFFVTVPYGEFYKKPDSDS